MSIRPVRGSWLGLAAAVIAPLSCYVPPAVVRPPIEKEAVIEAPLSPVWDAAVEWFATRGMPIKNIDKTSGLLTSEHAMPIDQVSGLMSCGTPGPTPTGKVEHVDHRAHFNVLLHAEGPAQTKVSVNAFFSCLVNTYENVGLFGAEVRLASSVRQKCASTGELERSILTRLKEVKGPAADGSAPAPSATQPAAPSAGACTSDAECRGGRVCRAGACTTSACAKDVDCPAPQICEGGTCQAPKP